jgi:hypothetical protein
MRYKILAAGLLFHLSLEYSLNIPMFQWDVLSAYVLFVDPADLHKAWNRLCLRVGPWLGEPVSVSYDIHSARTRRLVNLLVVLDIFHRLAFKVSGESGNRTSAGGEKNKRELVIATTLGPCLGTDARILLAKAIPPLWPLLPFVYLQKVAQSWK